MAKVFDEIDDKLAAFLGAQKLFFVATAPLAGDGLINLSPKGFDCFRVLGPRSVAYLDLVGSGVETVAHVKENGRLVILFCAFEGAPRIVRLHGHGTAIEPGDVRFSELAPRFPELPGTRSIIHLDVQRIADSCGYGVPRYRYESERTTLFEWVEKKGPEGVAEYLSTHNTQSLDGLPGLRAKD